MYDFKKPHHVTTLTNDNVAVILPSADNDEALEKLKKVISEELDLAHNEFEIVEITEPSMGHDMSFVTIKILDDTDEEPIGFILTQTWLY